MLNRESITLHDPLIDKRVYKAKILAESGDYVFKSLDTSRFKHENALVISVAASRLYKHFLGEAAICYDLVVEITETEIKKPVGMISPFFAHQAMTDEDDANVLKGFYPQFFTKAFGRLLAISFCLEEDDFHGANFVLAETGIVSRLDYDFSLIGLLSELDLVNDRKSLPLSESILQAFPFSRSADMPSEWIGNKLVHSQLIKAMQALEASVRDEFIQGIHEGFQDFADLNKTTITALLSGLFTDEDLLNKVTHHLQKRVAEVNCFKDRFSTIASAHLVGLETTSFPIGRIERATSEGATTISGFSTPSSSPVMSPTMALSPFCGPAPSYSPVDDILPPLKSPKASFARLSAYSSEGLALPPPAPSIS